MSVLEKAEYTLGRPQYHLRIKPGDVGKMVCAVSGNLVTGEVIYEEENTGLVQGWENAIAVTLEGIYRYESGGHEQAPAG